MLHRQSFLHVVKDHPMRARGHRMTPLPTVILRFSQIQFSSSLLQLRRDKTLASAFERLRNSYIHIEARQLSKILESGELLE
jgi:hypothetical protein